MKNRFVIGAVSVLLTALCIFLYYLYGVIYPTTENAYVDANIINISSRVGGFVERVYVKNNQMVKKGDKLIRINPNDISLKLAEAKKNVLVAQQEADYAKQQIDNATANKTMASSNYRFSQQMAKRYSNLYKYKAGSLQDMQKYINQSIQASKELEQANNALQQAIKQSDIAITRIEVAKINVANAKLQLSYTKLRAPTDGYISNLSLKAGQLIGPGEKLFALIEDNSWWIDANMKETQLSRIKVNQVASIELDMYSHHFSGVVQSISHASGDTFSLLPPQNASGNWVKVTQYFTVRIALKNDLQYPLRVGASASVSINTLKDN